MKKTDTKTTAPVEPKFTTITSLQQLRDLCEKPIDCNLEIDGAPVKIPVHRLPATAEERFQALSREVVPPVIKGRTPQEDDRFNYADPKYIEAKAKMEITIRALTIYEGCPIIRADKPDLKNREDVVSYVQGLFSDPILSLLYLTIAAGGVKLWDRVNFTQPPVSES